MSVRLFNLFVSSLRQTIPRHPLIKTGIPARYITQMEVVTETMDPNNPDLVRNKACTRYKKRGNMKRQWDFTEKKENDNGVSDEKKVCDQSVEKIKRKKMAMLLGYCGVDYYGMQRNPGVPTIEEELLKALRDAKYITEDDYVNQQNAQFQRSSRTDKGVSAARQVVSLKLPLEANIEEINKRLPDCIKVFGLKRATNRFNSKSKCNARTYSFTLPTFVFEPSLEADEERMAYRITAEKMAKVNEVLSSYKKTKSYHNFTEKKHYQDPSSSRYMMGFTLDRVFVASDMEFAVLLVKGQSFMIHQIRKMVGLMLAVVRGHVDPSIMEKAFSKEKVMIPTVPGLGLVLDKVHYERYDAKHKGTHDSLTWDNAEEAIEKFKHDQIYPIIVKSEVEGKSMATWLEKLKMHSYEPSEDVPEEKGEVGGGDDDDDDDIDGDDDESKSKDGSDKVNIKDGNDEGKKDPVKDEVNDKKDGEISDEKINSESEVAVKSLNHIVNITEDDDDDKISKVDESYDKSVKERTESG